MSGFLRRPLVVCAVVCAAARSGLPRLGTPGSSPSLSSAPADANCVSVSLSMLPAAAMRSGVGAGVVLVFSPASRAHCRPAHVENGTMMNSTQEERDDAHDSFLQVKKGSVLVTRMESITTYQNQHRQPRSGTQDQSNTPVSANDMCALDEWPSHARRNRAQLQDEAGGQKKKGRGVLKVGMNYRSFKDDVVVIMKRKLPLIGVRRWSDIHPTIHRLIVADIIDRWDLEDTPDTEEKDKACAEVKNKETETQGPLSDEQRQNIFQTRYKGTLQCKSSQPRGYGYMAKPSTGSERIRIQIEEQARATAAFQQRNSELSHQVNDLQDQLQAERANTQEIINFERVEREQLEGKLKEERAERERLLEAERTSRLKFEKNMMAKFGEFSKQMGTQQKLRGFALQRHEQRVDRHRDHSTAAKAADELLAAAQDMADMRNCYDNLLAVAAAIANSSYEFSEALQEMGTCLLKRVTPTKDGINVKFIQKRCQSLEAVEPHVRLAAEQQHIDHQFSALEDEDYSVEDENDDDYNDSHDGERSFDYGESKETTEAGHASHSPTEEFFDRSKGDYSSFPGERQRPVSQSTPLFPGERQRPAP
ncbi:hypothetical protein ZWY2020_041687 [Hordeum vulgare]|nr:hypothetical protein ZWY2020_041687 [Hordeum vulgare]